ncbi:DNA mismatch repair endonuclease MutL [Prevotella sp. KH2C16]|uniref:DNA mismatch repair endonuclease MutL n=1 Tax=Prevotella sp. KH2C16 TaxID=1855325 RepID=UPI0008E607C3|nr:DNA mismatch repair endonuclease MutL [Prevotella sp. KH2C16]SFG66976.1 DNA mismatch repair protein MutL [Prevotella sp. KH2C16]
MSDIIQLLPDSVANQIAAGEVIQRPASVIKELVENSVDAGAKHIDILVVDAGRTSIQVIDDGKGMSETDARLSFERHATSKIRKADDLFALHTMGFRGEALASIAAVAQIELKTRQEGEEIGTHLAISGSKFISQEPCSCPVGSNFKVENLFFNVPARRKFLKSNSTELNNILAAFERIVLVYPEVAFTFHSNGVEMYNLKACGLRQRIVDVFGKKLNQELIPVDVDTTICKIEGFIGKPESSRRKGAHQYFFVNGRYMKHPYFHKAVMSAFERLVPIGEQVPYFLYFEVSPEDIDVNIHPTKTEIKFENEQAIWQILAAAVKESIGVFNDVPSIDFDVQGKPDIPVFNADTTSAPSAPKIRLNPQYNPFTEKSADRQKVPTNWEELYQGLRKEHSDEAEIFDSKAETVSGRNIIEEKSPTHYQYKGKYIMTAVKSGLMVIDQHRAHVRILYEKYLAQQRNHKGQPQKLLFPEMLYLNASGVVQLDKMKAELEDLGFEINDIGRNTFAISSVPAGLDGLDYVTLIDEMLTDAAEKGNSSKEEIDRSLALMLARNAAVPQGQVLSNEEMENIVNSLFACENVNYTPDGKNIFCILKQQDIEHLLG